MIPEIIHITEVRNKKVFLDLSLQSHITLVFSKPDFFSLVSQWKEASFNRLKVVEQARCLPSWVLEGSLREDGLILELSPSKGGAYIRWSVTFEELNEMGMKLHQQFIEMT